MMWSLYAPGKKLQVRVWLDEAGALTYDLCKGERVLLQRSALGIETDLGDFTKGLCLEKEERSSIRETYAIPAGKKEVYVNDAEELALFFQAEGRCVTVRLRAFDNAMAFRYEIGEGGEKEILVQREKTQFWLQPSFDAVWLQDWVPTYEGPYLARKWEKSLNGQPFGMPGLFFSEADQVWLMINEANVINTHGSFCSCHLVGRENGCLTIGFAPEENGRPIRTPLPFQSPWRYVVAADDLDDLVNSTVNYNLNPPSEIADVSWIRPGRALWSWWEDMNGAQLYLESRDYVDMAAAYGLEGVTLDCGWDPCWVQALCEYAHQKGIQIWLWTAMQRVDTKEKAMELIPLWAGWGVDGLKIDFFENDSQHTMGQYHMLAELMKEYHLMINFHGSVKPMGEGRTWPHFMTAEGIMGLEHYQWSDMPNAVHNCTVPFTRNVAGPMDYTPTGFSNRKNRNTTMGHQMALPVVFDSGITNYALALRFMEGWRGTDFLRRTKSHYQGVRVLSGYPGDHAAILRYTRDEWLIGVITAPKKVVTLPLDFLGEGEYEAEIYEDADKGERITRSKRKVTAGDTLRLSLLESGGAGVYIARKLPPLAAGICSGYMSSDAVVYPGKEAKLRQGSEKVTWDEETEGFLLNGEAEFVLKAEEAGDYTLRFFYAAEEAWEMAYDCSGAEGREKMPASTAMRTFVTQDRILSLQKGENRFRIRRTGGKAPGIWKLKLINNHPFRPIVFGIKEEYLRGGGEVAMVDGVPTATGVGGESYLEFDDVCVPEKGRYVLRISYAGGDNRDIVIQANEDRPVETYLHSSAGWAFPNWENVCEKEVLIDLEKGRNRIRLSQPKGLLSHIKGIAVIRE